MINSVRYLTAYYHLGLGGIALTHFPYKKGCLMAAFFFGSVLLVA
ncbi:hypothetical protein VCHA48O428_100161 [Vibrio chagasii]|nr:hypothetical protein VCHA27O13_60192 [Vibrio chagasii]CAH6811053.1 hypothetical protein VCHA34O109_110182 [Vibrio chagasii]CAH6929235.1 hypothetical protein VCHA48O428_100161 [Vibrio chagasii]CAH6967289.1 hypothetical protein VCHA43P275_150121 [Vibrio chagasii]CAH7031357.1 hypothetical protein VCHA53O473_140122 [Vibrio chagasii]